MGKMHKRKKYNNKQRSLIFVCVTALLACIILFLFFLKVGDCGLIIKSTNISIATKGEITVEETWQVEKDIDMIVCSSGIRTPNPVIVENCSINGRRIPISEIELKNEKNKKTGFRYLTLKNPLKYYMDESEALAKINLKYKYTCLTKYQAAKYDSLRSFADYYIEVDAPIFKKVKIKENIQIKCIDDDLNLDCQDFSQFSMKSQGNRYITLTREKEYSNNNSILCVYLGHILLSKRSQINVGEFKRELIFQNIDRVEERCFLTLHEESGEKGLHFEIAYPKNVDLSNPDIIIEINGGGIKPFPVDSLTRDKILNDNIASYDGVYYCAGIGKSTGDPLLTNNKIEFFYHYPKAHIANIRIIVNYNPQNTGTLIQKDYYHYQIRYLVGHLVDFNHQDNLCVRLPQGLCVSEIVTRREYVNDSSSTYVSFNNLNIASYTRVPVLIDIEREGALFAYLLRWINIGCAIMVLPFVLWRWINKYFCPRVNLLLNRFIWLIIIYILMTLELPYLLSQQNLLAVLNYTYYYVPFMLLIVSLPFLVNKYVHGN